MDENVPSLYNKVKWLPAVYLPYMISNRCCSVMKKSPVNRYRTASKSSPIIGTMAEESRLRKQGWIRQGCNVFDGKKSTSQPMSFWTEQDVLRYLKHYNLEYASVYGDIVSDSEQQTLDDSKLKCTGCQRTGCIFCLYGAHLEKDEGRLEKLKKTHPRQFDYCMNGGEWVDNPNYVPDAPEYDGEWLNWNPKKIWTPSNEGLGLRFVIDEFNKLYPKTPIKY